MAAGQGRDVHSVPCRKTGVSVCPSQWLPLLVRLSIAPGTPNPEFAAWGCWRPLAPLPWVQPGLSPCPGELLGLKWPESLAGPQIPKQEGTSGLSNESTRGPHQASWGPRFLQVGGHGTIPHWCCQWQGVRRFLIWHLGAGVIAQ